jgi:spermidine synthase
VNAPTYFPNLWFTEVHKDHYGICLRIKETLYQKQSRYQFIEVLETFSFGRLLVLDGAVMLTERDEFIYHEMLAHVPLCAHPDPRDVLIIGGGDGGTLREVLKHPSIRRVDLVEIDEEVVETARRFFPTLTTGLEDPRTRLLFQDGIEFAKHQQEEYDAVLVDSTDPVGPAVGLFEDPFYQALHQALRPDGVLSLQCGSPFFDGEFVGENQKRLSGRFPHVATYVAPVVTYPGGLWGFSFASKQHGHSDEGYADRYDQRALKTRYITPEVHQAAFQLPRYIKDLVM